MLTVPDVVFAAATRLPLTISTSPLIVMSDNSPVISAARMLPEIERAETRVPAGAVTV